MFSQFTGAEMMAEKYGLSKDELDKYSYDSHQRAIAATQAGHFKKEIVPLEITRADGSKDTHHIDEGIRFDVYARRHQGRQADRRERQADSAASASQICDGASGVMVVNEKRPEAARRQAAGAHPPHDHDRRRPRDHARCSACTPPRSALEKAGMKIGDIDLFEVNEAFASVPTALAEDHRRRS